MGERLRVDEPRIVAEELQPAAMVCGGQLFEEPAPEQPREHAHRQEESRPTSDPALTVGGEATAGHDAVHMRMVRQRRAPGMQDQRHANLGAEMLGVGSNSAQGLGGDREQ